MFGVVAGDLLQMSVAVYVDDFVWDVRPWIPENGTLLMMSYPREASSVNR